METGNFSFLQMIIINIIKTIKIKKILKTKNN